MQIAVADFGTHLTGRLLGKKHFAKACELLASIAPGKVVILDFAGVQSVSGSWINAMLVPLVQWMADERNNFFPVLRNADPAWIDDLQMVAEWYFLDFLLAKDDRNPPRRALLVGKLDVAQRETLQAVLKHGEITGAQLERKQKENIKATAWNNRLRDLFEKRLIMRRKEGREQIYFPVVKEVTLNG